MKNLKSSIFCYVFWQYTAVATVRLFIKYQIPSDLLSYSDDLLHPGESATAEKRLELVKGQVQAGFLWLAGGGMLLLGGGFMHVLVVCSNDFFEDKCLRYQRVAKGDVKKGDFPFGVPIGGEIKGLVIGCPWIRQTSCDRLCLAWLRWSCLTNRDMPQDLGRFVWVWYCWMIRASHKETSRNRREAARRGASSIGEDGREEETPKMYPSASLTGLTFQLVIVRQCHDATSHHLSGNHQQMDLKCCGFIIASICSTNAGGKEKVTIWQLHN